MHDAEYMRLAIRLAMRGRGRVEPNPMVGCVIVSGGRVIGQGFHERFGGPHAEPNALAACTESPQGATAYVTLEPCCHTPKKTPPCVPRLIEARLARVVVGCADPSPEVAGKGIAQLRSAGIDVTTGVLEPQCKQLAAPFFARVLLHRPYVTLKWAQTADGKIAGPGGRRMQISNASAMQAVHRLRANCDSILVGVNTVLCDDPLLTARGPEALRQPARFVVDRDLRIPLDARVVTDRTASTTVFCALGRGAAYRRKRDAFEALGVHVANASTGSDGRLRLDDVVTRMGGLFSYDLLVEAGPTLAEGFFANNVADRLWVFCSPSRLEEASAPAAAAVPAGWVQAGEADLDGDVLREYLNRRSPTFAAAEPSADLLLVSGRV